MAVISLNERGDGYKQRYHASERRVSDLGLENAESLRQLQETRMMIGMSEGKNGRRLEAGKNRLLRNLREGTASTSMLNPKEKIGRCKGQNREGQSGLCRLTR